MVAPAQLRHADGTVHQLDATAVTIGRDPGQDISLAVPAVSRGHAVVERDDHGYRLRDLDSRNGTFVNGDRVGASAVPLRDGDEVVLAGSEVFRFVDPMGTPAGPGLGRLVGVWIDRASGAVWVDAQVVEPPLSDRQQALLELLHTRAGAIVSREELIASVWSDVAAEGVSPAAVDALVKRLKARLRPLQRHGDYVEVVRDRGVRLRQAD
ncbi:MAG: FHA domain-containing protein [Actinomycetota bacterium]